MNTLEKELKNLIIAKYGSLRAFTKKIDLPWTTLDSILKRGILNANIDNILKITRELNISADELAIGNITTRRDDDKHKNMSLSQEEEQLLNNFRSLNETGKDFIKQALTTATSSNIYERGDSFSKLENVG